MKIELTKEEYRDLIDMLYIADWIIYSHRSVDIQELLRYQQLRYKIYAFAEKAGLGNLIEYDAEMKYYIETPEFEEESDCHDIIEDYDNSVFWDRFVEMLCQRDIHREFGPKEPKKKKEFEKYCLRFIDIENQYKEEFEKNGLENVMIKGLNAARTD
ncbi:MAG: hypothetical protein QM278_00060 [Pseudomonadota bacterium]|nr:hypothetical protein [Pseudomonadota bacterium]